MTLIKKVSTLLFFLGCVAFSPLHHGWSNYDQKKVFDFTGIIQEFKFENPHATAKVSNNKLIWTVVLAPTSRMQDRGVPNNRLVKGSSLRVVGYPHKEIKGEMRAERIFIGETKYELR